MNEELEETKKILTSGMKIVYEIMASPELSEAISSMSKNLYDAFKEKGFSDEQAMKLTIGAMNSMSKNNS